MNSNKLDAKKCYQEGMELLCKLSSDQKLCSDWNNWKLNYEKAMDLINNAIKLDPDQADYYRQRAYLNELGEYQKLTTSGYEKAISDYDKEIEINPDSGSYFNRTNLYINLDKHNEAFSSHEEMLLNKSPDSFEDESQISRSYLFASHLALSIGEYEKAAELARHYFRLTASSSDDYSYENIQHEIIYLQSIEDTESLAQANKKLKEKEIELEEMMAMFAHKFRAPLDTIIYNAAHENKSKLYIEAAQTMRGLLDIFSVISTDPGSLNARLKQDMQGKGNLLSLLRKTLDMILLHLLSAPATEKIQQHYMSYAKAHDLCDSELNRKTWNEKYYELEQQLQIQWEKDYATIIDQSDQLSARLAWMEQHFFRLELRGFATDSIQFKEHGYKESLLMILLNEVLVNAFKFYTSDEKLPVILEWGDSDGYHLLSCKNPSTRSERGISKGSRKGHTFVSALARKTGSHFVKPVMKDDFIFEYGFPNELLIANCGS